MRAGRRDFVPGSADEVGVAEAGYRPLLFSIAYGMTGSVGDAEDLVQDAFVGLARARHAGTAVADPKAYLATAVTRLGIKYLRSARVRRETYVGDWLPEPVVMPARPGTPGRPTRCRWRSSTAASRWLSPRPPCRRQLGCWPATATTTTPAGRSRRLRRSRSAGLRGGRADPGATAMNQINNTAGAGAGELIRRYRIAAGLSQEELS